MLTRISADSKKYRWGSPTAIPELLGAPIDGEPHAELWLGAHPDSITRLVDRTEAQPETLNEWIREQAGTALGSGSRLPFLLKLLAADQPLSLQAHPALERARASFAEEESRGVPRDSPSRNYKDPWHKPELIVALHDGFEGLCGFRPVDQTDDFLSRLSDGEDLIAHLRTRLKGDGLEGAVRWVLTDRPAGLVPELVKAASSRDVGRWDNEGRLLQRLDAQYPGDPGVAVASLLNFAILRKGEALFLPAGNVHAYVKGLGVEVMASSDNVLRGGLTSKHVDVDEFLDVVQFSPLPSPIVHGRRDPSGYVDYTVPIDDFRLIRVDADTVTTIELSRAAIALVVEGRATLRQGASSVALTRGQSVFITPSESTVSVGSSGTVFIATGEEPS
ncbi:mannose-6-phosphate isomerase, class I [Microbacterium jejuense]|uniref:mannose-6-phosphate isomerase n=1 Tax=Microbacterium jejuense TaxID=1263637 RepID=A0ABS7HKT2_9MICO|nr:mannose-6-phosphate isomerase, class I [Microbacterium jejuense]MBW9093059.1 mannose-6-phosphate isomerase, class I [Microbacterium jejuense]